MPGLYQQKLSSLGLRPSLGRTGIWFDNALVESFFAALKNERMHRIVYPNKQGRADIANYIEMSTDTKRIHSGLDYRK